MLAGDRLDGRVVQQRRGPVRVFHVQLQERRRPEGRVRRNRDAVLLRVLDQPCLHEVRVVLDLQGRRRDLGVAEEVHDQLRAEVADSDALRQPFLDQLLHLRPSFLDGGFAEGEFVILVFPAWRIPYRRVDVFQGDWEMDDEEVEVVDAPIAELLLCGLLNNFFIVEAVP